MAATVAIDQRPTPTSRTPGFHAPGTMPEDDVYRIPSAVEAVVEAIGPIVYNTVSGAPPTLDPTDRLNPPAPEKQRFTLVRFRVTNVLYSDREMPLGFVIPVYAGTMARFASYGADMPRSDLDPGILAVGQHGIAFLLGTPGTLPVEALARREADRLGTGYRADVALNVWYGFDGNTGRRFNKGTPMPVAELRSRILDYVAMLAGTGATPTP